MIISERIFELLEKRGITQKEFSIKTGIAQSAISDWKRKETNPVSNKVFKKFDYYVIDKETEFGNLVVQFQSLDQQDKGRLLGYLSALSRSDK